MNILMLCALVLCIGCTSRMNTFQWLPGAWEMERKNGVKQVEVWTVNNDQLYGQGMKVANGDTTLLETLSILYKKRAYWYEPAVLAQNEGRTISFKMVSSNIFQYVFENPDHDFPQRIVYTYQPSTSSGSNQSIRGDSLKVGVMTLDGHGMDFLFVRK